VRGWQSLARWQTEASQQRHAPSPRRGQTIEATSDRKRWWPGCWGGQFFQVPSRGGSKTNALFSPGLLGWEFGTRDSLDRHAQGVCSAIAGWVVRCGRKRLRVGWSSRLSPRRGGHYTAA
jgi:hypothetical protein